MTVQLPEKTGLGFFPTPLEELKSVSRLLGGPRIFIKRDDQTGLAFGGNKVRKLEYLVADALASGADTLVTAGASQSNHCRQTAAAAARCGLHCHLVLGGDAHDDETGNLLLDRILGATLHFTGVARKGEGIDDLVRSLTQGGRTPYAIPYGGSNAIGALGFVSAMLELEQQLKSGGPVISHIVFASSSGGTHAGLIAGAAATGYRGSLLGIRIDKDESAGTPYLSQVAELANQAARRGGLAQHFSPSDIQLLEEYGGSGYGIVGDRELDAIRLLARSEGVLLDPVYTGRAFGALIDLVQQRKLAAGDTVLFWHTGGSPALFAYAQTLRSL